MFNPNDIGIPNGRYFALPFEPSEAALVLMSAQWDVTTSYRDGAARAPQAILNASTQVDLFDLEYGEIWQRKISTLPFDKEIGKRSVAMRRKAARAMAMLEKGISADAADVVRLTAAVNEASQWFNQRVHNAAADILAQNKIVAIVGGDHSAPFGLLSAIAEQHSEFGILHIDAHSDLRQCYEGFEHSHASIIYNVPQAVAAWYNSICTT
jgi:agmatinase